MTWILLVSLGHAEVLINEVLYDPSGSDGPLGKRPVNSLAVIPDPKDRRLEVDELQESVRHLAASHFKIADSVEGLVGKFDGAFSALARKGEQAADRRHGEILQAFGSLRAEISTEVQRQVEDAI